MVRIRFPSHITIRGNIDVLILDDSTGRERNCPIPEVIAGSVVASRQGDCVVCIPVSKGVDISCNLDRLANYSCDYLVECDGNRCCCSTGRCSS